MFLNVGAICCILTLHKRHESLDLFGWNLMPVSSAGVACLLKLGIPISPEVAPNQPNMKQCCLMHHVQTNTAEVLGRSSKIKKAFTHYKRHRCRLEILIIKRYFVIIMRSWSHYSWLWKYWPVNQWCWRQKKKTSRFIKWFLQFL